MTDYTKEENIRSRFRVGVRWVAAANLWNRVEERVELSAATNGVESPLSVSQAEQSQALHLRDRKAVARMQNGLGGFENYVLAMAVLSVDWLHLGELPDRESLAISGYQAADLAYRTEATEPSDKQPVVRPALLRTVLHVGGSRAFSEVLKTLPVDFEVSRYEHIKDEDWNWIWSEIKERLDASTVSLLDARALKTLMMKHGEAVLACRDATRLRWVGDAETLHFEVESE